MSKIKKLKQKRKSIAKGLAIGKNPDKKDNELAEKLEYSN